MIVFFSGAVVDHESVDGLEGCGAALPFAHGVFSLSFGAYGVGGSAAHDSGFAGVPYGLDGVAELGTGSGGFGALNERGGGDGRWGEWIVGNEAHGGESVGASGGGGVFVDGSGECGRGLACAGEFTFGGFGWELNESVLCDGYGSS
jgi:hypothetical protein